MAQEIKTQLLVLGGGPGGYTAALRAAELGLAVTMVGQEREPGGSYLRYGCIPSKALLHVGWVLTEARAAERFGVRFAPPTIDPVRMNDWKEEIVDDLAANIVELCRSRHVEWVVGRANFINSHTVEVFGDQTTVITFEHCVLAAGSRPVRVRAFDLPAKRAVYSNAALQLSDTPKWVLVVGGGYIGVEMASVYAALGASVDLVTDGDLLLPGVDRDLVAPLERRVRSRLANVFTRTEIVSMEDVEDGVRVAFHGPDAPRAQTYDRALISVGRRPNSDGIGLENTRVRTDAQGFVRVDHQQRTEDPAILAAGDLTGEPMLAHKAAYEGRVAAEVLAGQAAASDFRAMPAVIFTNPEIAWCGLTELEAAKTERPIKVARFAWSGSPRAQTLGASDGLTKLVLEPESGRVLGIGIVGPGAGELIAEGVVAVEMAAQAADLAMSLHPHATLSETLAGAAQAFLGHSTCLFTGDAAGQRKPAGG